MAKMPSRDSDIMHVCLLQSVHACIHCSYHALQSNKRLEKERTRLLCLAKMPFDDSDIMHLRLLQSVYMTYTGEAGPVSRYAQHSDAFCLHHCNIWSGLTVRVQQ